jgi:hypothetical protein
MTWPKEVFKEVGIGLLLLSHLVRWILEAEETWSKASAFFGRRKGDQREKNMSLGSIINGIALAEKDALALSAFMAKLPEYLPEIQKQLADLQKLSADRNNPTTALADASVLLDDLNKDLQTVVPMIQNLLPTLKQAPPAA